ncbi:hypothetical protein RF11_09033 [Thelohanellus kitauei]|uniref:Uncharacterized protein n=1 Tax=Thelohanellus kitauei TaxID=669202 RepID=A0A0C2IYV4_THEKT|nr:hypothetical protein RF11_09033 [Thelohanellus kitauei]
MQPIQKITDEEICKECPKYLKSLFGAIFLVLSKLVKWIIGFEEIAVKTFDYFLQQFALDIQHLSEENPGASISQQIVNYCSIETENFSIFNISHRAFVDVFMGCCVEGTIPRNIKDHVLCDEKILMRICRPAITALSFTSNLMLLKSIQYEYFDCIISAYLKSNLHYMYLQDWSAIQILISNLDPELFLKYMLFNIAPSMQTPVNFETPLPSLLSVSELELDYNMSKLLFYVYNALVERHYIGVADNPEFRLLQRQIIHSLAGEYQTIEDIRNMDEIIGRVSFTTYSPDPVDRRALKPPFFNTVNMFCFVYYFLENLELQDKILSLYKEYGSKFQPPDLLQLRDGFEGMNNFLYPNAFFDLIIHVLVDWFGNIRPSKTGSVVNLLLVSMSRRKTKNVFLST